MMEVLSLHDGSAVRRMIVSRKWGCSGGRGAPGPRAIMLRRMKIHSYTLWFSSLEIHYLTFCLVNSEYGGVRHEVCVPRPALIHIITFIKEGVGVDYYY